jgi:hypothetical protein
MTGAGGVFITVSGKVSSLKGGDEGVQYHFSGLAIPRGYGSEKRKANTAVTKAERASPRGLPGKPGGAWLSEVVDFEN